MLEVEEKPRLFLKDYYAIKLLRDEELRDYLIYIISSTIGIPEEEIKENFELLDSKVGLSHSIKDQEVDIVAQNDRTIYNVEVNYSFKTRETDHKNYSYICALVLKQLKPGKFNSYKNLKPIIQINLNNYDRFKQGELIYVSRYYEEKMMIPRDDITTIYDINLDFLSEKDYNEIERKKSRTLEKALYLFVCNDRKKLEKLYKGDELMEKVMNKLYRLSENIDDYLYYDRKEYFKNVLYEAGETVGAQEKEIEIIRKMLKKGMTPEQISELIDIPIEEVKKIVS